MCKITNNSTTVDMGKMVVSKWLSLVISMLILVSSSAAFPRPPLTIGRSYRFRRMSEAAPSNKSELQTYYYPQTLDHFNYRPESYTKFKQRYVINFKYWGGAKTNAPILVYFGDEDTLDNQLDIVGFLSDNAAQFKALLVYIEHRFYGKSVPFGSMQKAIKNSYVRGYFNSAQALADFAEIILHIKATLHAQYSPVIVVGGSYGGLLATWFRLKYPHVALGAVASSAPVLYFDNIVPQDALYQVVTKDFKEASETCFETIRDSWAEIDKVASQPNGLKILSEKFKTCSPLQDASDLKQYLRDSVYENAAQYDEPPHYPVSVVCKAIDGYPGDDVLAKIFAGAVAHLGNQSCYPPADPNDETNIGWPWQTCSELVFTYGIVNNKMIPPDPFNLTDYIQSCKDTYGVVPRPHWITDYYGGHDIKLILKRFGSNIIFSNGLRDPWSSGGVLDNISDTVVAIYTANGSHTLDILPAKSTDPEWLIWQRKQEVEIVKKWIVQYYADLNAYKQ